MSHGFQPTGLFLAGHTVFGVFEPADHGAYLDAVRLNFEPSPSPRVYVYVASFDEVSPWPLTPYLEASVLISVRHGTMEGWFPLMMPVTSRVAMMGGRRRGFPKEMADISLAETDRGWAGSARQDGRLLLSIDFSASGETGDEFDDPRSIYFGAPIFNLVPPLRGPKVVATTIESLEASTVTRLAGEVTVEADPGLGWAPLLQPSVSGYFERSRSANVLRHGRVAAQFASPQAVSSNE
jgi:hypothetical protein